jgi:hypothetical protein
MTRIGDVLIAWGDGAGPGDNGEYRFCLTVGDWRNLQKRLNCGPPEIFRRLSARQWLIDEPREVIRTGLEGGRSCLKENGSIDDQRITRLLNVYFDQRPPMDSVDVALKIVAAGLMGVEDDPIPKSAAAESAALVSQTGNSLSPPSTDGDQFSATRRKKSTRSRSGSSERAKPDTSLPMVEKKNSRRQVPTNSTP